MTFNKCFGYVSSIAQIPVIELYIIFKEVVVALYHQADDEEEEPELSIVPEKRGRMGTKHH